MPSVTLGWSLTQPSYRGAAKGEDGPDRRDFRRLEQLSCQLAARFRQVMLHRSPKRAMRFDQRRSGWGMGIIHSIGMNDSNDHKPSISIPCFQRKIKRFWSEQKGIPWVNESLRVWRLGGCTQRISSNEAGCHFLVWPHQKTPTFKFSKLAV